MKQDGYLYELLNHPKQVCPNCGKKEFNGLVYKGTKKYVDLSKYGRCDRQDKCKYECFPEKVDKKNIEVVQERTFRRTPQRYRMQENALAELQKNGRTDNFSQTLSKMFPNAKKVLDDYGVVNGSNEKYKLYTGFVYRDLNGTLLSVKMFSYKDDLHRDKEIGSSWLHKWGENRSNYEEFSQSYYGEHLIKNTKYKFIGIVESEKTALIARMCDENILWLACGGVGNMKASQLKGISDKPVIFYPDHDGWDRWKENFDKINNGNWRISKLPLEFTEKQDIADKLLEDKLFINKINEEFESLYTTTESVEADKYYRSITRKYSEDDWNVILQKIGLSQFVAKKTSEIKDVDGKKIEIKSVAFFENGSPKNDFEFFDIFKDKFLDNFCTQKQIAKYSDLKEEHFSFNFEKHEFLEFLQSFPKTFFNNYIFHIDDFSFYYNGVRFEIDDIISAKLSNLERSSLNEEKEKITSSSKYKDAITDFKNIYLTTQGLPKIDISLGTYEKVLERGRIFNERNGIEFVDDWKEIFSLIWNISDNSFNSLVLWCIANIKCRLFNDNSLMRTITLYGDGGTGKDNFLPSFLIGLWRYSHSDRIWENSSYGATGFSTETPEKLKTFLAQIISDDIEKVSASTRFDMITNPIMQIENKGQNVVKVRKRFLQIITNNSPRVLLDKKSDEATRTALARRILLARINAISQNPMQRNYYDDLFKFFDIPEHQDIFAGFWYSCYLLRNNDLLLNQYSLDCFKVTMQEASNLNYLTEADDRIITVFEKMCEEAELDEDGMLISSKVSKKSVDGVWYYVIKSVLPIVDELKNQFGKSKVKTALASKYGSQMEFSRRMVFKGEQKRVIAIPCDVIDEDESKVPTREELEKQPIVDIVAKLKDCLWFEDNEPTKPLFAETETPVFTIAEDYQSETPNRREMPDDDEVNRLIDINETFI